jgi:hypothetical protein
LDNEHLRASGRPFNHVLHRGVDVTSWKIGAAFASFPASSRFTLGDFSRVELAESQASLAGEIFSTDQQNGGCGKILSVQS